MENSVFKHGDAELYYEITGSGDETLLFAHGHGLSSEMWKPQIEAFNEDYRCIAYDLRGYGKSSDPTGPYSHVDDLYALIDHLKIADVHILGCSKGGRLAVNVVLEHPKIARSLTLMSTALDGFPNTVDWNVHFDTVGLEGARQNWKEHEIFTHTRKQAQVREVLDAIIDDYSGWHWEHNDPHIPEINASDRLGEITIPTLVIVGENDLSYFQDISSLVAERIPRSEFASILDAGHLVNMEKPEIVNELLENFIKNQSNHSN